MSAKSIGDIEKRSDGLLWNASCSLKGLAAILSAVNSEEVEIGDHEFHGIGQILLSIAMAIDAAQISDEVIDPK